MNTATGARILSYGAGIVSAKSGADISIELSTADSIFYGELTEAQARGRGARRGKGMSGRYSSFREWGKADAYYGRPKRAPFRATRSERAEYRAGYDSLDGLGAGKAWGNWAPLPWPGRKGERP